MVAILLLVASGCGDGEAATLSAPAVTGGGEAASVAASPAPVESTSGSAGCWTDQQRSGEGTEGNDVAGKQYAAAPAMAIDPAKRYTATVETNKGSFEVEFYPSDAPTTVNNFVCLARDGYFDGTPFHRIVPGFVIQGGDPTGTGSGGPGYRFADEPIAKEYEKGTLAMANAGPNTNGSQFFVVLDDLRGKLPKNYTIFGRVIGGGETVDAIAAVPVRRGASGEVSQPTEAVTLQRVTVQEA